jgi:hypothetical protein
MRLTRREAHAATELLRRIEAWRPPLTRAGGATVLALQTAVVLFADLERFLRDLVDARRDG